EIISCVYNSRESPEPVDQVDSRSSEVQSSHTLHSAHTLHSSRSSLLFGDSLAVMSQDQTDDVMYVDEPSPGIQQTGNPVSSDDYPMTDLTNQDIYTDQGSRPTDPTHSSDSQRNEQVHLMQNSPFLNGQGFSGPVVTQQPGSTGEPKMSHDHQLIHQTPPSSSRDGQFSNVQDIYTATGDQFSRPAQNDMKHQNFPTDPTHGSDSETLSSNRDGPFPNDKDSHTASAGDQDSSRPPPYDMKPPNSRNATDRKHSSDSQRNEQTLLSLSRDGQFPNDKGSHTAGAEGLDSRTTLSDMKKQSRIGSTDRTHSSDSQSEEDNCKVGNESQPSAPLDVTKFMIKVDWREPFPERWGATLEKALQSWLLKMEGTPDVVSLKLMDDPSYAEVQINPSAALEVIKKLKSIPLTLKHSNNTLKKEVTAWICQDKTHSVTGQQKPFMLDKNRFSSPQVNSAVPSGDKNSVNEVAATNSGLAVPLYQFWYMHHAYRKELEQIEKQHGVAICAEVSVSIK
ncbi:hypothetical protein PO909_020944, partial [Leuciscus waleckii]